MGIFRLLGRYVAMAAQGLLPRSTTNTSHADFRATMEIRALKWQVGASNFLLAEFGACIVGFLVELHYGWNIVALSLTFLSGLICIVGAGVRKNLEERGSTTEVIAQVTLRFMFFAILIAIAAAAVDKAYRKPPASVAQAAIVIAADSNDKLNQQVIIRNVGASDLTHFRVWGFAWLDGDPDQLLLPQTIQETEAEDSLNSGTELTYTLSQFVRLRNHLPSHPRIKRIYIYGAFVDANNNFGEIENAFLFDSSIKRFIGLRLDSIGGISDVERFARQVTGAANLKGGLYNK